MIRVLRLLASLAVLALGSASCAPLVPPAANVSPPPGIVTWSDPAPIGAASGHASEQVPARAREHLLYPYNLPSYGNDLAAELERGARTAGESSRSP